MFKRRSINAALSVLLLILFSAVALPLDLLHNHKETVECSDFGRKGACTHKVHLSNTKSFCFACAIHFDKTFLTSRQDVEQAEVPWIRIFLENKVTAIVIEPILTLLRGPPGK